MSLLVAKHTLLVDCGFDPLCACAQHFDHWDEVAHRNAHRSSHRNTHPQNADEDARHVLTAEKSAGNDWASEERSTPSQLRTNFRSGDLSMNHPRLAS